MERPVADSVHHHPPTGGSGWSAVAQTVRDVDEAKVKDCKEDIDTLLVFAGLFSAVLTAFVIESYKLLQQDNSDVVVRLLQQIAEQTRSYQLADGALTSSAAPPVAAPAFRAPAFAVQVNVLWFASLAFSLMTASFGMLVKQWLREYMAVDYISPQARLRARHFRHPGLRGWKVFEAAAVLPVLLQAALALFFLGLCLFTSAVHPSVGRTAVPLVSGWTMLVSFVVLAPLCSPRCPFKLPLLAGTTKLIRVNTLGPLTRSFMNTAKSKLCGKKNALDLHWITTCAARGVSPYEEEAAVLYGEKDVEILINVDATLADDKFVVQTMWTLLLESGTDAHLLLLFIKGMLCNRTGLPLHGLAVPMDFREERLMGTHWQIIVDLAAELIERELVKIEAEASSQTSSWPPVLVETMLLILCPVPTNYNYPEVSFNRICTWLQIKTVRVAMWQHLTRTGHTDKAVLLLETLEGNAKRWWKVLSSSYIDILDDVVNWASSTDAEALRLRQLAAPIDSGPPLPMILSGSMSATVLKIYKRIILPEAMPTYRAWYHHYTSPGFSPALDISLPSFLARLEATAFSHRLLNMDRDDTRDYFVVKTIRDVLLAFFGLSEATRYFLRVFARRPTLCYDEQTARIVQYFLRRTRRSEPSYISVAVEDGARFAFDFVRVLDELQADAAAPSPVRILRLCYLALVMLAGPRTTAMSLDHLAWRILFSRFASRLLRHDEHVAGREAAFLAEQCLYKIEVLEGEYGDPHGLRYRPDDERWPCPEGDSLFGEYLVEALSSYTVREGQLSWPT